jgi:general secretion pathway protein G
MGSVQDPPPAFRGRGTARRAVEGLLRGARRPLHHASHGPPPLQKQGRIEGFTLVELMVVLVILGLLATMMLVYVIPALTRAKTQTARTSVQQLEQAIDMYYLNEGRYPTNQEGLQALLAGRYLRRLENDPWGHPFRYKSPGDNGRPYQIASLGADGREGGSGDNADITN